jgi:hypothetical protein
LFTVLIKNRNAGQERLFFMCTEAIGPKSDTSDFLGGEAPCFDNAGKMAPTICEKLSQFELPPPPDEGKGEMHSNLGGVPEDYNCPMPFPGEGNIELMPETDTPSPDSGQASWDDTATEPAGEQGDGAADGEVTHDELLDTPDVLPEAGIKGLEVTGMELSLNSEGMLSQGSKEQVNELVGNLTDQLGGIEVVANCYVDDNGNVGLHLTSGDSNSVTYYPKENTVYSVHTHPGGSTTPSQTDLQHEIEGAQDAIVPADGIPGNEDGSDYYVYA